MGDITGVGAMCKSGADVCIRLIDTLEKLAGWIDRQYSKRPAEQGKDFLIQSIKDNNNYSEFEKAALITNVKQILKQYSNQEQIIEFARRSIAVAAKPEDIHPDWINKFMDYAKNVTTEEMQLVWGKLLAAEASDPGTIPQKVMYILATLDPSTARLFNTLLSNSLVSPEGKYIPIIQCKNNVMDILEMEDLVTTGLAYLHPNSSYEISIPSKKLFYFDVSITIDKERLRSGCMYLSKYGEMLARIITVEEDLLFPDRCLETLQKLNPSSTISCQHRA